MDFLSWKDAVIKVLEQSDSAMHYTNIAESILEQGFKEEVGATPANRMSVPSLYCSGCFGTPN